MLSSELREACINTIRFLSADGVEKAKSGHPGTPMGAADIVFTIWNEFLRYNPQDPEWAARDRFVLSPGHASMLLYSMLHLSGYEVSLEDLKQFRQWGSLTPGHPEYGHTPGVECTTGPLGAGFSNAVGMALASKMHAARFNTEEHAVIDSNIYVLCSDGDIQEGVCAEAASFAGNLGLGNLVVVYDKNDITIAGDLGMSMSENTAKRFEAYGWHVQECDGHDVDAIRSCLQTANQEHQRPSMIVAQTKIGKGSPNKEGKASSHGAPLGEDEILQAKQAVGWPTDQSFYVPEEVKEVFQQREAVNTKTYEQWQKALESWKQAHPQKAQQWEQHWNFSTPENLLSTLIDTVGETENATRSLSGMVIQKLAELFPSFTGGSADLEPSTVTLMKEEKSIVPSSVNSSQLPDPSYEGRNIHFGIREHAMGSICNGMFLFGGWRPYAATFSVFSDYMRGSIRLAAISELPTTFIFTHDSFCVGEDGPTHQPIEQTWALRLIPNLEVWRPSDAMETAAAWTAAMESITTPTVLMLTRQKLQTLERSSQVANEDLLKGAYIVQDTESRNPQLVLMTTGSEGKLGEEVRKKFEAMGLPSRHVSVPCLERFKDQPLSYIEELLPTDAFTVAIESGVPDPWFQVADYVIGQSEFGKSAPYQILLEKFGFTVEQITEEIEECMKTFAVH